MGTWRKLFGKRNATFRSHWDWKTYEGQIAVWTYNPINEISKFMKAKKSGNSQSLSQDNSLLDDIKSKKLKFNMLNLI